MNPIGMPHIMNAVDFLRSIALFSILVGIATNASARTLYPPPFIQDRAFGKQLADQMEQVAASGKSPTAVHRECRRILRDGLSQGGQRFRSEFPRGFRLDFSDPQYRKIGTNLLRGNRSNWHGYLRELKYLNEIARKQSPFRIVSVGDRAPLKSGKIVEFDALLEDKRTGLRMSAEFKDWKINSRANLDKAKLQIDKIARRAREQGVSRSMWVNRARLSDRYRGELEEYARRRNVSIYSGTSTSNKLAHNLKNPRRFDDALEGESRLLQRRATRAVERSRIAVKHESKALRHIKIGRIAGRAAGPLIAGYEAYEVGHTAYQWKQGAVTTRKATISASEGIGAAAGGLAGAATGAYAGGAIGTFFPPAAPFLAAGGGVIGGIAGAIGGSMAGGAGGTLLVDQVIYKDLEEKETDALIAFLQQHYQPAP
jgi:hypothetical protein